MVSTKKIYYKLVLFVNSSEISERPCVVILDTVKYMPTMKNISSTFALVSVWISLLQALPSAANMRFPTKKINFDRTFINGVRYGMNNRTVLQKLGKPKSSKEVRLCYGKVNRLNYPGMIVDIQRNNQGEFVSGIEVAQQNLGIDGIVKVGDSISLAKKAYSPNIFRANDRSNQWYARPNPSEVSLGFKTNKAGTIVKISVEVGC